MYVGVGSVKNRKLKSFKRKGKLNYIFLSTYSRLSKIS